MSQIPANYQPSPLCLKDRVVLITGAGEGLGRAMACGCAEQGATVILLGRTIKKLEKVYDRIEQNGWPAPAIYPMNLEGAAPKDYEEMAQTLTKEFGRLDGLVHNAALLGHLRPLELYDPETWYQVMQVNLHAPFLMTRALIPVLKQSEAGSILFISDAVGRQARAYWGAYAVAKSGLEGLMQLVAHELDSDPLIRVNSFDPGPLLTSLRMQSHPGEDHQSLPAPETVLDTIYYLLGPDSAGVSGQAFSNQTP